MLAPMGVLAACCALIGLAPVLIAPVLGAGIAAWDPGLTTAGQRLLVLAPLGWVAVMSVGLSAALLASAVLLWRQVRRAGTAKAATWGCGYVAPTPRMQYTSSSFAQMLVRLFAWALRPRTHRPGDLPLFPAKATFHSTVPDPLLDEVVLPGFRLSSALLSRFRVLQRVSVQTYLLYIFLALIVLLLWR
jgi:hydrogenase-4 component B